MNTILDSGLIWWITAVDIPVLSTLFWMIHRTRRESVEAVKKLQEIVDVRSTQLRGALSAFKLEVAKSYASVTDMKDLESRIVSHLLRIESKLDQTALKTEALRGKKS
jgi:L-lysine 2,3-aminomutase